MASGVLVLCDMDGVLYRGAEAIPGAADAVSALRAAGHTVAFATNNGWTPVGQIAERLRRMGIAADEQHVVGASWMAAELLRRTHPDVRRPYVVGGAELRAQLRRLGMRPVDGAQADTADALAIGLDLTFTYRRLARAQRVALRDVPMVVTDADAAYPWQDGWMPGTGALLAAVERSCGRRALQAGKPEPHMYAELIRRFDAEHGRIVVVGDNLDSDIAAGRRLELPTVLALTGISTAEAARARPAHERPDRIVGSIAEVPSTVAELFGER